MADEIGEVGIAMWRADSSILGECVVVQVMQKRSDEDSPRGLTWSPWSDGRLLEDLGMKGWVSSQGATNSEGQCYYHADGPNYREVSRVTLDRAKAMVAMLTKIERVMKKEDATEDGEVMAAFIKAVDAKWVCIPSGGGEHPHRLSTRGSSWADTKWTWWRPVEGKKLYRGLIAEAIDATKVRLGLKTAA